MPSIQELQNLLEEIESLKEQASRTKGKIEQLRKSSPHAKDDKSIKLRLEKLEKDRALLESEFTLKKKEFKELYDEQLYKQS